MEATDVLDRFKVQAIASALMNNEMSYDEFGRTLRTLSATERRALFERLENMKPRVSTHRPF